MESQNPKLQKLLKTIDRNDKGQLVPNNQQIKELVRYDEVKLGGIDTSKVTSFRELFKSSSRADFSGISSWDTSRVTTFMSYFEGAESFNENINDWNVSNATNFMQMFYGAKSFNQPLDKWDTAKATNMIRMFLMAVEFNQNIQSWNMSNVIWAWEMFAGAEKFNQPLNDWDMSSVQKIQKMFLRAKDFNQPLDKWNISNVVDMQGVFSGAESFNQNLREWGTKLGKVRNAKMAFANTKSLENSDFLKSWKFSSFCDKENLIKGSKLESSESKMKSNELCNFVISQIDEIPNEVKAFESSAFMDFYAKYLPKNIKETTKIYLGKYEDNSENLVCGSKNDDKSWNCAFYEVFNYCFVVEKFDKKGEQTQTRWQHINNCSFNIIQSRKESELQNNEDFRANEVKDIYESNDLRIKLDSQNMWIVNNDLTDNSESILGLLNVFILAQSYIIQMQELEEIARENGDDSRELQKCYKKICDFDLRYYRNQPILQNVFLQRIWSEISKFYMLSQTHNELKEIISQMAQILGEDMREREGRRFNIAMGVIGVLSALGAILAAVPVIQSMI